MNLKDSRIRRLGMMIEMVGCRKENRSYKKMQPNNGTKKERK